jgi:hypothetical protein
MALQLITRPDPWLKKTEMHDIVSLSGIFSGPMHLL